MRLHGEGASADLLSVEIVRKELPPLLADIPLNKIYNFVETCICDVYVVFVASAAFTNVLMLLIMLL